MKVTDNDVRKALKTINEAAMRASGLVRDMMTFSRKQKGEKMVLDLAALAQKVAGFATETFDRKIKVTLDYQVSTARVFGDQNSIEHALINLVVNARDALMECEAQPSPEIRISISNGVLREGLQYVTLDVSDNGPGIKPEHKDKIFDPFFTTKDIGKGTGLGLFTVYGAVKQNGGWIEVDSELGKGASFKIYLPSAKGKLEKPPEDMEMLPVGKGTILVVEDDPVVMDLYHQVLTMSGYQVISSLNGAEGVEKFRLNHEQVSLVILDISMPEMSGTEAYQAIRSIDSEARIVISSGYAPDKELFPRVDAILEKPVKINDLLTAVQGALN